MRYDLMSFQSISFRLQLPVITIFLSMAWIASRTVVRAAAATSASSTTAASTTAACSSAATYIAPLDPDRCKLIGSASKNGVAVKLTALEPMGAKVEGLDLKGARPSDEVMNALEAEMANRGFLVFKNQHNVSPEESIEATKWWGGREIHSTHGVHPATPGTGSTRRHIFRLSNDRNKGILGVGPQWHNDGAFEEAPFSHVTYHMLQIPDKGGGTHFVHQGAAYDVLDDETREYWSRLTSVNSNSGVVHPVVHEHYLSRRKTVYLHMGMTGAVIEKLKDEEGFRLLEEDEMKDLFTKYNALLNDGFEKGYGISYEYEDGDIIFIDNYAIAHRASPEAHLPVSKVGLRVMHRVTAKAPFDGFKPQFGLPQYINIYDENPFGGNGVWIGGGIGFRFHPSLHYQN